MAQPPSGEEFPPLEDPNEASAKAAKRFHQAAARALSRFQLTSSEREEFNVIMGRRGATQRLLASNKRLRTQSAAILINEFGKLREEGQAAGNRRYWHVSFLGPLIKEYQPELDVDAYREVIDRLLRSQHLNAVFAIELQPLTNYPQKGQGRSFLLNGHAFAWTDNSDFDADDARRAMCGSTAIWSEFGAPIVKFSDRDGGEGSIEYLAHYMTKAPDKGKRRRKNPGVPGRWELYPVGQVRDDQQLRLMEILSQLELSDLIWGVNDGKAIRRRWKIALVSWNKLRCEQQAQSLDKDFDTAELWQRVRSNEANGSRLYQPLQLCGPRPKPLPGEPQPRNGGRRLRPGRLEPASRPAHATKGSLRDLVAALKNNELDQL